MPIASTLIRRFAVHATIAVAPEQSAYLGTGTHTVIANGITPPPAVGAGAGEAAGAGAGADAVTDPDASSGAPPFVYIGRLEPRKDVATLLRAVSALRHLPREGSRAVLPRVVPPVVIAGDGPSRATLEQLCDRLGLQHVQFVGAVSDADKWSLLRSARCVIAPAHSGESFGIVLLEAMAAGALPIAADNPGYRHVLHDGGDSLLYAAGDHRALAEQLARVLDAPEWCDRMQTWCAQHWPRFQWEHIARHVEVVYRQAMAQAS
jgi:phosphatidylinositol alpha-mannosyltransferase